MKCLDKKRIKMKNGETLALNERIMLSLVSTGVSTTHRPQTESVLYCQQNFTVLFSVLGVCLLRRLFAQMFDFGIYFIF